MHRMSLLSLKTSTGQVSGDFRQTGIEQNIPIEQWEWRLEHRNRSKFVSGGPFALRDVDTDVLPKADADQHQQALAAQKLAAQKGADEDDDEGRRLAVKDRVSISRLCDKTSPDLFHHGARGTRFVSASIILCAALDHGGAGSPLLKVDMRGVRIRALKYEAMIEDNSVGMREVFDLSYEKLTFQVLRVGMASPTSGGQQFVHDLTVGNS